MSDFIMSEDYKKFLKKQGIELSDWEKATLFYNNRQLLYDDVIWGLLDIEKHTSDEVLKKQIEDRLSRNKELYEGFQKREKDTYYVLFVWSDTKKYEEQGSYLDFVTARQQGKEENTKFLIEKRAFECIEAGSGKVLGGMEFDEQGYRKNRFWLYSTVVGEFARDIDNTSFEDKHVKLPLMFRRGDIVHIIGTELYGIVDAPENDEEEEQYITVAEKGDYSDFQVPVNLMYEDQKFLSVFSHEHCAPTDIEYARLDEQDNRKGFLEYMKKTLYEKSFVTGPGRDKGRFGEILSKLEKVWNQYPDLRLGQLLVNVCGKSDLFMIEDEELLERLQYNQFPIE